VTLSKEVKVGLLALVAGIVLYVGFNYLKGIDFFSPTKKYFVVYDNVGGLTVSNPVTLNGMTVGRVDDTKIMTDRNNMILVTVEIDDKIKVGDGTIAVLKNSSFLGGKEISLTMNPNRVAFKNGDTINSTTKKEITDEIGEKAMPVINQLDSIAVKLNNVFDQDFNRNVHVMMNNFAVASNDLRETLAKNKSKISDITTDVADLTESLKETQKKFGPLVDKMNSVADTLNNLELKRVVNNANNAMKNLNEVTAKLNGKEGTLGMLIHDKALYENLNKTTADLDELVKYFNYNPKFFLRPLGSKPGKKRPLPDSLK
jgi:phospholipid/cholesterol/gamma-HCH transport system substrate-binding protein